MMKKCNLYSMLSNGNKQVSQTCFIALQLSNVLKLSYNVLTPPWRPWTQHNNLKQHIGDKSILRFVKEN